MDGRELLLILRQRLDEVEGSGQLDDKTSYRFLYDAATEFVERTSCLHASTTITIVADQAAYTLPADYLKPYLRDTSHRYYLKFNDGTNDTFVYFDDYEAIYLSNNTTSQAVPNRFTITDVTTLSSRITGTATSTSAIAAGESTLTDSGGNFSNVSVGDIVHNSTDGSDGIVLAVNSTTSLLTALFGGTLDQWSSGDAYVIQPQGRMQIILDPPPLTAGNTITFPYVQKPAPVFSDYGVYRFPSKCLRPIVTYALYNYKYRDRTPNTGDRLFQYWDREVRIYAESLNQGHVRKDFRVNLKKRV